MKEGRGEHRKRAQVLVSQCLVVVAAIVIVYCSYSGTGHCKRWFIVSSRRGAQTPRARRHQHARTLDLLHVDLILPACFAL